MPIRAFPGCGCRGPTSGPARPRARHATCRSSASRSTRATTCRSGPAAAFTGDLLYDRGEADATGEVRNQVGGAPAAAEMTELLVEALRAIDAPAEQLARLGVG